MNIENEIFNKTRIDFEKLINYGFIKEDSIYKYSKNFIDSFRADIYVDINGDISGKIYDLSINDEYVNFRIENQTGEFVNRVREEYKTLLTDIRESCCEKLYFVSKQANRITDQIISIYNDKPEFIWEKFPGYGVFRNPNNKKWYALVANVDKSKLDIKCCGKVEILNIKLDEETISNLLTKNGFYPAYHMNKKNWITIILDDTLKDEEIIEYIKESHKFTE